MNPKAYPCATALIALLGAGCPEVRSPKPHPIGSHSAEPAAPVAGVDPDQPEPDDEGPIPGLRVDLTDKAMGTRVVLAAYTTDTIDQKGARAALAAALAEIRRIEAVMTTWSDKSEVSRVNAAAGGDAVAVSDETFGVIAKSLWISKLSEGTFDITFASMGKLWNFDEGGSEVVPSAAAIKAARGKIDYRKVKLDDGKKTVQLESADTKINLGGIAKGYAIDRAAGVLRDRGLTSFYAQAGGDLYVEGDKPAGGAWRVGIRDPRGPDGTYFAIVEVKDHAFSTSGDYERGFVKNGTRYHHIIDPRTGYPATASRSVTIWAKDAITADSIDNAVFILGPEKGLALVESLDGCGAVIVDAANQVHISERLKGKVKILREPTPGI